MANPLHLNLKEGDPVIVAQEHFESPEPPERRTFVCMAGEGMYNLTTGCGIMGHWQDGRGSGRIESFQISPEETRALEPEGKKRKH